MLPNEEEQFEDIRKLLKQSYNAPAPSDQFTQRLEERLQTLLPVTTQALKPARTRNRYLHWIGRLSIRQRMALGGIGAAAVLAILLFWLGSAATPLSAMEQMAENIRKAKSFKFTVIRSDIREPGKPPVEEYINTVYWLAPGPNDSVGSIRVEMTRPKDWKGPPGEFVESVWIQPAGKPVLCIEHKSKTFYRDSVDTLNDMWSTCEYLQDLGKLSGEANRELGTKEINGKKVRGFEIENKKIDPNNVPGPVEIWIDTESKLPVSVHHKSRIDEENEGDLHFEPVQFTTQITDIQWNISKDTKLLDTTPPEGYSDTTPKPPASVEEIRHITAMLKTYADTNGGHYPQISGIERLDSKIEEWFMNLKRNQPRTQYYTKEFLGKLERITYGGRQIVNIEVNDPEAAYYGKTVGPNNKDKILLRWKIDDGKYAIIYGDLHYETVTAEKLHSLEEK